MFFKAQIRVFIPKELYGRNLLGLLHALRLAPENRFPSLRTWYRSPNAVGGSRESRRKSCWRVIRHGWATATKDECGRWECALTEAGRCMTDGRFPDRRRRPQYYKRPISKGIVVEFSRRI